MAYTEFKITDQEAGSINVQSAPNVLVKTPQENKLVFDKLPDLVRQRFNGLIDQLTKNGYFPLQGQENLLIRINSENLKMEFSLNGGVDWQTGANEGHRIVTNDGTIMPQKSDLQFKGASVTDEQNRTVVEFFQSGEGVPEGGLAGQILRKRSDESFDNEWATDAENAKKLGGISANDYMRVSHFADPENPDAVLKATNATTHIARKDNPHGITKAQVGLGNVSNVDAYPKTGGVVSGNIYTPNRLDTGYGTNNRITIGFTGAPGLFYGGGGNLVVMAPGYVDCMNMQATGYVTARATAFTPSSSLRYKENVQDISLEKAAKLLQLRPVEYDLKSDGRHSYGFIAEEVAQVDNTTVHNDENGLPNTLDYMGLIAPLLVLVKNLTERIQTLEKEREAQDDTI